MTYSPTSGLAVLPATGAALGSIWLFLLGLTILMVALAALRLMPKKLT